MSDDTAMSAEKLSTNSLSYRSRPYSEASRTHQSTHPKLTLYWDKELSEESDVPKYLVSYNLIEASSPYLGFQVQKPLEEYITGSSYRGTHNHLSFNGYGVYYFPHGVAYEGTFRNGEFHGSGVLIYPNGQEIDGIWKEGKLTQWKYKFADGLEYSEDWDYLRLPNRSYQVELAEGFQAAGLEYVTPSRLYKKLPPNTYDVGNNQYYDDTKKIIFSKDGKMQRVVAANEIENIRNNYREETDQPVKYRPEFYEYWCSGRGKEVTGIEQMYVNQKRKESTNLTKSSASLLDSTV